MFFELINLKKVLHNQTDSPDNLLSAK